MDKKISVVIITLNEENIIEKCLSKLKFAEEIIVVDSGSVDRTVAICEQFGAKVFYNKFEGYGLQKQFAVAKTRNDWVFALDADEILTDELINEIDAVFRQNKDAYNGFLMQGNHVFMNKIFKYGHDNHHFYLRLFNKKYGNFNSNLVHESVSVEGNLYKLKNAYLHYSYDSIEDYIKKLNNYTNLLSKINFDKGKKYSVFEMIIKFIFEFVKKYLIHLNFLNGKEGFIWSSYSAVYTFTKCVKTNERYKSDLA